MSPKRLFNVAKYVSAFLLVSISSSTSVELETEISHLDFEAHPVSKEVEACNDHFSNCENFTTYPRDYIEKLIRSNLIEKEVLLGRGVKMMDQKISYNNEKTGDTQSMCNYKESIWHPQGRTTIRGEFIYIVQMEVDGEQYYQSIPMIKCENDGTEEACKVDGQKIKTDAGQELTCHQEKISVNVVGVTPRGKIVRDELERFFCCSCQYVKNGSNGETCIEDRN